MFVKSDIRKMTIAFEKAFFSEVYLALGKAGIIHLARFHERDSGMDAADLQDEEALTREIISGTEYVLTALLISPEKSDVDAKNVDRRSDATFVSNTKKTLERALRLQAKIREERDAVSRDMEYIDALGTMGIDPGIVQKARLIKTLFGTVENTWGEVPSHEPFLLTRTGRYVFGLARPENFPLMLQFLKEYGFADKSTDVPEIPLENLRKRAECLKRRSEVLDGYINRLKEERGQGFKQLHSAYRSYEEMLKAVRLSLFSARAMFITGWMDLKDKERLAEIMQGICSNRFVVSERRDPDAPVRLLNMRLFKPFELLVKTMGMPSNSEIDPTPLTAVTFVLMFGLMFGDLGQGLVLMLGGLLLKKFGQKKLQEELVQGGGILLACGLSAAVCGLLYGSIFSSEHIIPALWFHPTAHIMKLFTMTILIGVVFIIAGLCVNILNGFNNTDYTEALLEKRGLAVLVLYTAMVFFVLNYQRTGRPPALWAISVFIFLPLILFSLRGVLGFVLFQKARPHNVLEYVIETVMDIVEIALSLFANTISFIRVGAFALSHAGLSVVTYTLAAIADPAMKSVGALIIIVVGNIFIIGFEGLICGIQSMRLEYYEFFSKFFKGDGVVFSPFTLKAKASEV
jgi:vacuolar-type H+-ATPase subunit I/STV1